MDRPPQDVTDAELAVLQVLWDRRTATIRQLTDAIYPAGTSSQYGTVQKLLERLEAKGCVLRDRDPWPHVFAPALSRDALIGLRLRAVADQLCGGSLTPLLTHLVESDRLADDQRQALRARLDELDRPVRQRGGTR
jgi:BlaI family transcriptional regulator, penicillinase repressor